MNKFCIDVKAIGYSEVVIWAETYEEAEEKAMDKVLEFKVKDLRYKQFKCTNLERLFVEDD